MKLLQTIYEFHNKELETTCGLYQIETNLGRKYYLLRNDESVGAIQHLFGRTALECIVPIRDNVKQELFELLGVQHG